MMLFASETWEKQLRGKERAFRNLADSLSDFKERSSTKHREDLHEELDRFAKVVSAAVSIIQVTKKFPLEIAQPSVVLPHLLELSNFFAETPGAHGGTLAPSLEKLKATAGVHGVSINVGV